MYLQERDAHIIAQKNFVLANTRYLELVAPIRIRLFIYFMEDQFRSTVTSVVLPAIEAQAVKGKKYDKHILDRMLKWYNILVSKTQTNHAIGQYHHVKECVIYDTTPPHQAAAPTGPAYLWRDKAKKIHYHQSLKRPFSGPPN